MRLVSVDPGAKYFAWAVFDDRVLTSTGIWTALTSKTPWRDGKKVVEALATIPWNTQGAAILVENMVVYPKRKTPPNDLIAVQTMVGALLGAEGYDKALLVDPATWKGQRPKTVCKRLCKAAFQEKPSANGKAGKVNSAKEYAAVNWDNEHIVDALGIGLHHLNRAFV